MSPPIVVNEDADSHGNQKDNGVVVALGEGPPTRVELDAYYPGKFTWQELKMFINSGDLGTLKRDKKLQLRYMKWSEGVKKKHGSMVNYLVDYRLRWGEPDTLSKLPSVLDSNPNAFYGLERSEGSKEETGPSIGYFSVDTPRELLCIIQNDWPYSVPSYIEHSLVWTKVPILPSPTLIPAPILKAHPELSPTSLSILTSRLAQDGICGFTGLSPSSPPPSPSLIPTSDALVKLGEWGITLEKLVRSPSKAVLSEEERGVLEEVEEITAEFIRRRWKESEWETAWFVNPPRLQSVKGLAHTHVFARKKTIEETADWLKE